MKEVVFKKLQGKNFLSIGNIPIEFDFLSGINIITGFNHDKSDENGVGKTSVVQLFYWVLFGVCLSNLKKNEIVNDINGKGCFGSLEFEVIKNGVPTNYKIERGIKPSFCKLYVNGETEENPPSIQALNKQIENIISASPIVFRNCITLSMNDTVPFLQQGKPERRNFVESIFRLEVLRYMEKIARQKYNEIVREQDTNLQKLEGLKQNQATYQQKFDEFEENKAQKIKKLKSRKEQYAAEIKQLEDEIVKEDANALNAIEAELTTIESELTENASKKQEIEVKIKTHTNELQTATQKKESNQSLLSIDSDTLDKYAPKEAELVALVEKLPNSILDLQSKNNELKSEHRSITSLLEKIEKYGDVCDSCERPFSAEEKAETQNKIDEHNTRLSAIKDEGVSNKEQIEKLNEKSSKTKTVLENLSVYSSIQEMTEQCASLESEIEVEKATLTPLSEAYEETFELKQTVQRKKNAIIELQNKNKATNSQIININKFLSSVEEDVVEAENENNTFDVLIKDNGEKLTACDKIVSDLKSNIEIFDNIKFIVSEEGIKSYIINKLLKALNERIDYYLNLFESNAKLTFDEYFDYELYNDKNLAKSYENFSNGERKRIDLACLFSFLDIRRIQGDVRFNVIFFDELLDSAISAKACDLIFSVLKERNTLYNENAYIITHRKEFKSDSKKLIDNTILLEKRNGFTKLLGVNDDIKI